MSNHHTDLATRLQRMAIAVLKIHADLEAMEKIVRQGPRPQQCLAAKAPDWYINMLACKARGERPAVACSACGHGPCPWGRPLQPGEVIE